MINLTALVPAGSGIWWSQASAEPTPIVNALLDHSEALARLRMFVGLTWNNRIVDDSEHATVVSYGALGSLRHLAARGSLEIVPCHYSALPRLFRERLLPSDVGIIQVSPPDRDGTCSLGIGVDYAADALQHTPILVAEINHQMPATHGTPRIPLSRFAAVVETDRPLPEAPDRPADGIESQIARRVAELVNDGDTIQIGVGGLPAAVLEALSSHRDLGMHSGMIADGVVNLVEKGVLTGARKEIDRGLVVTGAALGSSKLYRSIEHLPVEFRPTSYTHSPEVLSQLTSLVSINSGIEVDLTGQVGSESRGDAYIGAVGGQADFSGAAALTGARSIIALRSAHRGESAIKATLANGSVTTARSDVDFVVTEHGTAALRGCDLHERARRLIAVAAPEHRESLERELVDASPFAMQRRRDL